MTIVALADVLAENNFGDTRAGNGLAGPIGLLIILALAGATILLIRNMNARLRRLPASFSHPNEGEPAAPTQRTDSDNE